MPSATAERHWTVSEVAERTHVTVRTLHHYHEIGLLKPSARSGAGYRLYSEGDLERLYQILLYRELGFPLEAIGRVMDDPAMDRTRALKAQRDLLTEKRRKTDAVIAAVDRLLDNLEKGTKMTSEEMMEGFDAFADAPEDVRAHQAAHGAETHERWGDTDAYRESMRRARGHGKADWARIKAESEANEARMAELLAAGTDPAGPEAMDAAETMREHISRWFYECGHAMHVGLADMYEADLRFTAHYDDRAPGLARFVAEAIRANARRAGHTAAS